MSSFWAPFQSYPIFTYKPPFSVLRYSFFTEVFGSEDKTIIWTWALHPQAAGRRQQALPDCPVTLCGPDHVSLQMSAPEHWSHAELHSLDPVIKVRVSGAHTHSHLGSSAVLGSTICLPTLGFYGQRETGNINILIVDMI